MDYLEAAEAVEKRGEPQDSRYKVPAEKKDCIVPSRQADYEVEKLMDRVIEVFPYPIQISRPDGTIMFANETFYEIFHITDREVFTEKYNMMQDPLIEDLGIKEEVLKAFQGETVRLDDIKVPIQDIIKRYGAGEVCLDSMFLNIVSFPVYNEHKELTCVASVFITSRLYCGKEEIILGKEYIENHWQEDFDMNEVANASGFSKTQFTRLFKARTGMTPLRYYLDVKINMLKVKLLDTNLSISQAFSACGLNYNGHYAKLFKDRVGTTPSEYRRMNS